MQAKLKRVSFNDIEVADLPTFERIYAPTISVQFYYDQTNEVSTEDATDGIDSVEASIDITGLVWYQIVGDGVEKVNDIQLFKELNGPLSFSTSGVPQTISDVSNLDNGESAILRLYAENLYGDENKEGIVEYPFVYDNGA